MTQDKLREQERNFACDSYAKEHNALRVRENLIYRNSLKPPGSFTLMVVDDGNPDRMAMVTATLAPAELAALGAWIQMVLTPQAEPPTAQQGRCMPDVRR